MTTHVYISLSNTSAGCIVSSRRDIVVHQADDNTGVAYLILNVLHVVAVDVGVVLVFDLKEDYGTANSVLVEQPESRECKA